MRRIVPGLLACALAAGLLGGCDSPTGGESGQVAVTVLTPRQSAFVGTTAETLVRFHVADAQGNPVAGTTLSFTVSPGARVEPVSPASDAVGNVDVIFTLGATAGEYTIDARAPGSSAAARYTAMATTLKLDADSATLALPSCGTSVAAKTFDNPDPRFPDQFSRDVSFAVTEPGIVELVMPLYHGMPVRQRREVKPLKPGTTRIIAAYQGGSDTMDVRVFGQEELIPRAISVSTPDTIDVPVGAKSKASIHAFVVGQGGCLVVGAKPAITSADPGIARIVDEFGTLYLAGQAPGDTRIDFRHGNLAATRVARARHVRVSPADTTIRVGGVVTYRLYTADASGVFVEQSGAYVHVFGQAASRRAGTAIVTGMQPGNSEVIVWAGGWEKSTPVKVVAAP